MNTSTRRWLEIVRFEIVAQLRRKSIWFFLALFMFPLIGVTTDRLRAAPDSDILFNAPFMVAQQAVLWSVVSLLILAAIAGDAATRDVQSRMEPLMHTAPIRRSAYVSGRFIGAFAIAIVLLTVVPIVQVYAGLAHPGTATEFVGSFRAVAHAQAYALLILPDAFVATALMFALSARVRHTMGGYAVAALMFIGLQTIVGVVAERLGYWELASLLDPTGFVALEVMARTWSPLQLNEQLIGSSGVLIWNRLLWLGVSGAVLAATAMRPRFREHAGALRRWRRGRELAARPDGAPLVEDAATGAAGDEHVGALPLPVVARAFGGTTRVRQTLAMTRDSLREVLTAWSWLLVPIFALKVMENLAAVRGAGAGTRVLPTTARMLAPADDLAPPIVLAALMFPVIVAGELVWRERDANMQALTDSVPVSDGVRFLGKVLALWLVLVALHALVILAGMVAQASLGWYDFEPWLYVRYVFGMRLAGPLLFALFAISVHTLVNQKHVGHLLVLAVVAAANILPELFGVEHPLLRMGYSPNWRYSAMSGFDPFVSPVIWFKLYWGAWALMLALIARLFWVRGVERGLRERLRAARGRLTRRMAGAIGGSLVAVLLVGGFIFYNTNVLNDYRTAADRADSAAEYERRYARYRGAPQPTVERTVLNVELYPELRQAEVSGTQYLVNRTTRSIDTLHVAISTEVETGAIEWNRAVRTAVQDDARGHRIYVLAEPMRPGDSLTMQWQVRYQPRGFPAGDISTDVVANGTFITMSDWVPRPGYQVRRELTDAGARRERGLPPRTMLPSLYDVGARSDMTGRDRFQLDITIGTSAGQTAVAPGVLQRSWSDDGRRYFRYATDAPVSQEFAIFSADYAVRRSQAGNVALEVYHNPRYDGNVDRVMRGMQSSITRLGARFGAYPYSVLRFVEYPSTGGSLHASAATIWYQELFSLFDPEHEPRRIDLPFAVTAHEVAHQWWGSQGARVEGIALLSESLAWYSALGVVEAEYGREHLARLLRFFRESYLRPRARAGVPLLRASDSFLAYRKGPFAMYALREYVGEEQVDAALRKLQARYDMPDPPFATTLDLYRELQAVTPDSLQYLLADLFERNTFWELDTKRATMEQTASGAWQVRLDIMARKVAVDTVGVETEIPMDDLIEVGIFAPAAAGEDRGAPLHLMMHRVHTGEQTLTITVPQRPALAGIDPRYLLIDVDPSDNVVEVTDRGTAGDG
ncbi:MAG TPA: hypothetical protein VFG84_07775 [Gemmatimonadaceae bacterium]|nr:hypothetical protein [Gemmatimonadaceae bacterium]